MRFRPVLSLLIWLLFLPGTYAKPSAGNRLAYLDEADPFYPHLEFPRLTTPQWIADTNVEAVVVLAIDDMKDPARYEAFIRPILNRLKQVDPQAGLSIMTVDVDPSSPQLQTWLKENVSLEVHTLTHPCPLLARTNFLAAAKTYYDGIGRLFSIPGNRPVAFRMPCCDSINSPSPRFYAEIFNRTNGWGQFLQLDSSVMNIFTAADPLLSRSLGVDRDGKEQFRRYLPFPSFVTTIENYPYPYVIGRLCWEFPGVVPSDWEAQHLQGTNNPVTVKDWKAALDATVIKQGVFNLIFHPHGWIKSEQVVEFIDYAAERYGRRVKFLNFHQASDQLRDRLLAGQNLRSGTGEDNGVRLLDLDGDGYLDVVVANGTVQKTRRWLPVERQWRDSAFPIPLTRAAGPGQAVAQFGVLNREGRASLIALAAGKLTGWHFRDDQWVEDSMLGRGVSLREAAGPDRPGGDPGLRLRDLDGDGVCELLISNPSRNAIFSWSGPDKIWKPLDYALPAGVSIVTSEGQDNGLRFVDVNEDGYDDVLFSNAKSYSLHLFVPKADPLLAWKVGWSDEVARGSAGDPRAIPPIVRAGEIRNNGAWFHSGKVWWQNEETSALPDYVDRRSFGDLLKLGSPAARSPAESLRAIHVHPGFKVELVAAEPLITDPIAFDWDASGKLWVVEMVDYPLGLDGRGQPGGVVRVLEDTNADGVYDRSTIFLDHLNFPTGLIPWKKGVIISGAPDIFYAEDTDGDGKADRRQVLLTGFHEGNQQHRVNGFELGLDHWLYAANGDSGGEVHRPEGGPSINISGRDLRFKPDAGLFEAIPGQTQFGRHRDDWGNWFGNNNPNLLWHYYLPERYLKRNPFLATPQNKEFLPKYPDANLVYPASRPMARFNFPELVNRVTSANSATPYRDDLFGAAFARAVFISEPVHNLVHLELLEPEGVTFASHRHPAEQHSEFLASEDNWFRPTMLKTGPDGALYIADMYRLVLEHPQWIPPEMQKRFDLRAGAEQGRIYRVYPENARPRPIPRLDQLDPPGLVKAMESPNGWQRDTAQRLLVEKSATRRSSANLLLKRLALGSANRPQSRLQALATMSVLSWTQPDILVRALADPEPAIRVLALELSEPFLNQQSPANQALKAALLRLVADSSIPVRYQLAFTLGEWEDSRAGRTLAHLFEKDFADQRLRTALLSSAPRHCLPVLQALLSQPQTYQEAVSSVAQLAAAQGNDQALAELFAKFAPASRPVPSWQFSALQAVLEGFQRRNLNWKDFAAQQWMKNRAGAVEATFAAARRMIDEAPTTRDDARILEVLPLLARASGQSGQDVARLEPLLRPQWSSEVQRAAAQAILKMKSAALVAAVTNHWAAYSPSLQIELLNMLISDERAARGLLDAAEQGVLSPAAIGPVHRQRLLRHGNAQLRRQAEKIFAPASTSKAALLASYQEAVNLRGDPARGETLFRENCAVCHRFKGQGTEVGPPLETVQGKAGSVLLAAILDPNQAFEPRYANYLAHLKSNREISGIIISESPNSITMRGPAGTDEVILRSDLKELQNTGRSLMPEGIEVVLSPQAMGDLLEFIRQP